MLKEVEIFTDGACLGNPGPGGWAALLRFGAREKMLSQGFSLTTNNRMEILAVVEALAALLEPCAVTVTTDSQYVCHAVEKRWLQAWVRNGWQTAGKKPVKNRDLWERLLPLLKFHKVRFAWIKGHSGHAENERCDQQARAEAEKANLPPDTGFMPDV